VNKNKQEQHFTYVGMGNLLALLPNMTPLVSRFSCCQRNVNFKATVLSLTLKKVLDFGKIYGRKVVKCDLPLKINY
jgi:hypothetical protein